MPITLRVLIVEDDEADAVLLVQALRRAGFDPLHRRVEDDAGLAAALAEGGWQAVLADHSLPHYSSERALRRVRASGLDVPFIIVSGVLTEDAAVGALRSGAHDFMVKGNLARLGPALERELRDAELRAERRAARAALQAAAAKFRAWVETIPAVTYEAADQGVTYISPQIEALLGYSPAEWLAQRDLWEQRLHPEDRARVLADYARALAAGQSFQAEYRLLARDGRAVWVLDETRRVSDPSGPLTVLGVYLDITARKQAEADLRLMTEQLIQTARLATMGELAGSIAHQLNNPLAIVALRVEQMQAQAAPGSPNAQALEAMAEACERMRRLVDHLLTFSQRGARQVSTLDLCREAESAVEFVRYPFSLRNIACEFECAPDAPHVRGDRQGLRQVFLNLLTNAGDAMPEGGRLSVRVAPAELNGAPAATVEVRDSGRGIAPEDLPHVWDMFYTTRAGGSGTGLGLAICRRIVEEHGGVIDLASQPGVGTLARVVLPLEGRWRGER